MLTRSRSRMASSANVSPTAPSVPTRVLRSTVTSARARATASVGTSTEPSSSVGTSSGMRASTSVASVNRGSNNTPQRQRRQRPGFSRTHRLMLAERKLVRAWGQVNLLKDKVRGLTKRYQSARAQGFKSYRYNLRLRLAAVEGVRNMYYEYIRDRADEIDEIYDQNVRIESDDEEEDMEDDAE